MSDRCALGTQLHPSEGSSISRVDMACSKSCHYFLFHGSFVANVYISDVFTVATCVSGSAVPCAGAGAGSCGLRERASVLEFSLPVQLMI